MIAQGSKCDVGGEYDSMRWIVHLYKVMIAYTMWQMHFKCVFDIRTLYLRGTVRIS